MEFPKHQPGSSGRRVPAVLAVLLAALWMACGNDDPTGLGSGLRQAPDTLRVFDFRAVQSDTVFHVPVALGRSPLGQVGRRGPYTAHILYDFQLPTRGAAGDTLDSATLVLRTDPLGFTPPFEGRMTLGASEIGPTGRDWHPDSIIARLPPRQEAVARDTVLDGAALVDSLLTDTAEISFEIFLERIDGFRAAVDSGTALDINVALEFKGFTGGIAGGFLEIPFRLDNGKVNGFAAGIVDPIATVGPARRVTVVEFDSTYSPGTKLVVSDGHRLHSHLRFRPLPLPDRAVVHRAELHLTPVRPAHGESFGVGPEIGVMVPLDTIPEQIFSKEANERALAFRTTIATVDTVVTLGPIVVTAYIFDIQEGNVYDRGMLLRLSNEGTKARHFEFYGAAAADTLLRPYLRVVYTLPAGFERSVPARARSEGP